MMIGIHIPFHADGGSGEDGQTGLFFVAPGRSYDGPKAYAGKGSEVPGAKVLLSDY
jgi:hypothetical protein